MTEENKPAPSMDDEIERLVENYMRGAFIGDKREWIEHSFKHGIDVGYRAALAQKRQDLVKVREALEFYAKNKGLFIDHKTNVFRSADSDDVDFHGKRAREALALLPKPKASEGET